MYKVKTMNAIAPQGLAVLENAGVFMGEEKVCDLYIASLGDEANKYSQVMAHRLRGEGLFVETDVQGRGFNAQMKYANKIGAKYLVVLGDDEIANGAFKLKNMQTGEQFDADDDTVFNLISEGK